MPALDVLLGWEPHVGNAIEPSLRIAIAGMGDEGRDRGMSIVVTMRCDQGHAWVLPLSNTSHVVMPDRCPKCTKWTNPTIAAVILFEDNGSPSVMIARE